MTRSNISSQIVQRLGFIWLGRIPTTRNGKDSGPRKGMGRCICCQQPLQILASPVLFITNSSRDFAEAGAVEDVQSSQICKRIAGRTGAASLWPRQGKLGGWLEQVAVKRRRSYKSGCLIVAPAPS